MRVAFGDALTAAARDNEKVLVLTGDHGYALFDSFRESFPERFLNLGIAEQNMIGVAAGLAKAGYLPIVYGLASFVPMRVLEQIKIDLLLDGLKVILVGDGAGFVYSSLGASHQCGEDISALRALPTIRIASPADALEMHHVMRQALECSETTYVRMGKSDLGSVHQPGGSLRVEELIQIVEPNRARSTISFICTGSMVITARELINAHYPGAGLWSAPTLRPFDKLGLLGAVPLGSSVVTIEEHYEEGGLGSIVCEILSEHAPSPVLRIGAKSSFSHSVGSHSHVLASLGLDSESIRARVDAFIRP
jgi:transketolase